MDEMGELSRDVVGGERTKSRRAGEWRVGLATNGDYVIKVRSSGFASPTHLSRHAAP